MKRILAASPMIICILYIFLPLCKAIGSIFGYDFVLNSYLVSIMVLASISIVVTVILLFARIPLSKVNTVFSTLLLPLSAINGLLFVLHDWKTSLFALACCGCSAVIFKEFGCPGALKKVTAVLSALVILLLVLLSFVIFVFSDFGSCTVVRSVASPQNTYVAEVIDVDQGALGGDTLVNVQTNIKTINLLIGKFSKAAIHVYRGEWGEFEDMQIGWKDERTLIINGKEYYTGE